LRSGAADKRYSLCIMKSISTFQLRAVLSTMLLSASLSVFATSPPPRATFEQVICKASHVFVGTAKNFRVVEVAKDPGCSDPSIDRSFLTMCTAIQATVSVQEALFPIPWDVPKNIEFRFGGGLFSIDELKKDLINRKRLFHVIRDTQSLSAVYIPSHPWQLGGTIEMVPKAKKTLKSCVRN